MLTRLCLALLFLSTALVHALAQQKPPPNAPIGKPLDLQRPAPPGPSPELVPLIRRAVEEELEKQKPRGVPIPASEYEVRFRQAAQEGAEACQRSGGRRVAATMTFLPQQGGELQAVMGVTCEYDVAELLKPSPPTKKPVAPVKGGKK